MWSPFWMPLAGVSMTLAERIAELIEQHGSLRAAARVLECDAGYLSRLQSGEKDNPEVWLLRRMNLRRVVSYERTAPLPPNTCKLTECRGKPRCKLCLSLDCAYGVPASDHETKGTQ